MSEIAYTVICKIDYQSMEEEWLEWLRGGHIDEVIRCGAKSAEIVKRDKDNESVPGTTYEIRYKFDSRAAMDEYLEKHAMRLRAEGLERFPTSEGFHYERIIGEVIS